MDKINLSKLYTAAFEGDRLAVLVDLCELVGFFEYTGRTAAPKDALDAMPDPVPTPEQALWKQAQSSVLLHIFNRMSLGTHDAAALMQARGDILRMQANLLKKETLE